MSGIVSKVLKRLVFFPIFLGAFLGWLIVVHLGLEGLGACVFLVFVFLFCVAFVSVLFALLLVLWLDVVVLYFVFVCSFSFLFLFWFFFFCFFGGFKGQVRWPKGPPHLAPNPPYFIFFRFFVFVLCFVFFCFLVFAFAIKALFPPQKGIFCIFSVSPFVSL